MNKIEPGYLKTQKSRLGLFLLMTGMPTTCHIKILYTQTTRLSVDAFFKDYCIRSLKTFFSY